ncbi:unnamed protein product [Ectocarpus fasciculatus]
MPCTPLVWRGLLRRRSAARLISLRSRQIWGHHGFPPKRGGVLRWEVSKATLGNSNWVLPGLRVQVRSDCVGPMSCCACTDSSPDGGALNAHDGGRSGRGRWRGSCGNTSHLLRGKKYCTILRMYCICPVSSFLVELIFVPLHLVHPRLTKSGHYYCLLFLASPPPTQSLCLLCNKVAALSMVTLNSRLLRRVRKNSPCKCSCLRLPPCFLHDSLCPSTKCTRKMVYSGLLIKWICLSAVGEMLAYGML